MANIYMIVSIEDVKLGYKVTGTPDTIVEADLPFANNFVINANVQQIEFVGDATTETIPIGTGFNGTIAADKFTTDVLQFAAGITPITTGLPADELARWYPEKGTYPFLRARVILKAKNAVTGAFTHLRLEVPKLSIQNPWTPGQAQNNTKLGQELAWAATKTEVDLLGTALPGITGGTGGVHYLLAELTA
jgi:hypothetical protein